MSPIKRTPKLPMRIEEELVEPKAKIRSVTIQDVQGKVLIKIYHRKGAYWVEKSTELAAFTVEIRDEQNCKTTIRVAGKGYNGAK